VIVACFASHIHRVQQIADAAAANGRKVAFLGRSMLKNVELSRSLGLLSIDDDVSSTSTTSASSTAARCA
jgi:ribonuclease J